MVPTNRPVDSLTACMELALETRIPLIVICSKLVQYGEVIDMAADAGVKAYALDLPVQPANPRGAHFRNFVGRRTRGRQLSDDS